MSSILKALRKLEQENQTGGQPNIPQPLFAQVDAGRSWSWRVICGALLAGVMAGGVLTVLILNSGAEPPVAAISSAPAPVTASANSNVISPTTTIPPAAALSSDPEPSVPIVAASAPVPVLPEKQPVNSSAVEQVSAPPPAEIPSATTVTTVQEVRMEGFDIPPAGFQRQEPRSDDPLPYLVSEIVYLDEGGSMAVVNDLPVMEGTVVDGALLKQILADRIVLELDGRLVEVGLALTPN